MADPAGPIQPGQHEVSGVSPREQRTVEGEEKEAPGKAFQLEGEQGVQKTPEATSPAEVQQTEPVSMQNLQERASRVGENAAQIQQTLSSIPVDQLNTEQKTRLEQYLRRSTLEKHLGTFNNNLTSVAKQMGVAAKIPKKEASPLKTYLGWLTNGQATMKNVASSLASKGPGSISTSDMLRSQAQLQAAERAISFATAVAGKAADFVKTMLQTQI